MNLFGMRMTDQLSVLLFDGHEVTSLADPAPPSLTGDDDDVDL